MNKNKMKFISSEKKKVYAELWKKSKNKAPIIEADEKAGYPPNCNKGYVEKDGKCVPILKKAKASPTLSQEQAIDYSVRIMKALEAMRTEHNKNNPQGRVTINQLKEVYCKNASDCRNAKAAARACNHWAMGCVNAFLRLKSNKKIKKISVSSNLWTQTEEDFLKTDKDMQRFELNFDFENVDDLYIEVQPLKNARTTWV
jgi:hypothetical protein